MRYALYSHFAEEPQYLPAKLATLLDEDELEMLISLKKIALKRQGQDNGRRDMGFRRGHTESASTYEARLTQSARAAIIAELRNGIMPADLYRTLGPYGWSNRVAGTQQPHQFTTGSNNIPLPSRQRPHNDNPPSGALRDGESVSGNDSPRVESPRLNTPRGFAGPRPSFSISAMMRPNNGITAQPFADRTLERTDDLVRNEIKNAEATQFDQPVDLNISKLGLKLTVPEYNGGDTIDELLRFVKELTNYFLIYNLMKPDMDRFRVSLLGQMLKGKAQKWYQHAIDNNADGAWTFEETIVALKQYFVKDTSSRDVASKFKRTSQKDRTVMELKRELE
jgi:hypothetical protein